MKEIDRTDLPAGTVTFLFTDIAGSTQLLQQLGGEKYGSLLADQRAILRAAFEQFNGREIDTQGDSFFASFPRASDAVNAVIQMQQQLAAQAWPDDTQVRVRMGLHTGEPWLVEEGYVGMDVHRAARIAHSGHSGQVLLSETTAPLVRGELPEGVTLLDLGRHRLKDMRRPEHIHQLSIDVLAAKYPPLNSLEDLSVAERDAKTTQRPPRQVGNSPYQGLAAFQETDAQFFFGREAFTEELHDSLHQRQLVAVIVGSSGAGKSSAVFAGLLPQLRTEGGWLIVPFRPGGDPFHALATALLPTLEPDLDETDHLRASQKLADGLAAGEITLHHTVERILGKATDFSRLLLVIDQFEELYTLVLDPNLRQAFLDELLAAVAAGGEARPNPLAALLTLRADFMGQALTHRPFADALQAGSLMLGPMNRAELQAAIEKPAELQGAAFEPGLVTRILEDVGEEPGNLPLLEFALTLLWDRMETGWITHEVYDEIGRVEGALARYADEVYTGLPRAEQEQVRRAMVQLVQPGQGTEDTRRVARRTDLVGVEWGLVQHLADRRLVVTGRDEAGSETVEVVHEALIRGWGQLRKWMNADRAFRTWQEGLRASLRGWENSGQDDGALLRGGPLAQAEDWLAEREDEIGDSERAYIQASADLRTRRQAERERRRRLTVTGLAIGLIIAVLLSIYAFSQRGIAQENAVIAQAEAWSRATQQVVAEAERAKAEAQALLSLSRELAAGAIVNLEIDPERSILLALHALSTTYTLEAERALHTAVQGSPLRQTIRVGQEPGSPWFRLSPDGNKGFSSGQGGGTMWDVSNGNMVYSYPVPDGDWINRAAFSPDGSLLILPGETYDEEGNDLPAHVTILDAQTGQVLVDFEAHESLIQEVAVSPDGKLLASVSFDLTARLWDLETTLAKGEGQLIRTFCCHEGWASAVEFSPNGGSLVTAGGRNAILWEVSTGQTLFQLGPDIETVTFSPDGRYLVSESEEGLVQVWDVQTGERQAAVNSSNGSIAWGIAFKPDGSMVGTSKLGGQVVLWNFSPGAIQESRSLLGHSGGVGGIAFSPDGKKLITNGVDGTIRIWDVSPSGNSEFGAIAKGDVNDSRMINSENLLVTVGDDGMLRLWDTSTWDEVISVQAHDTRINAVDISPDGKYLATAADDGNIKIWEANTWQEVHRLTAHIVDDFSVYTGVFEVEFSRDGMKLVSVGYSENVIKIWDVNSGNLILEIPSDAPGLVSATFSPDGNLVAAGGSTVSIWDSSTGERLLTIAPDDWLRGNRGFWGIDFSPDGSLLALGRTDSVYEVWKIPPDFSETGGVGAQRLYHGQSASDFILTLQFTNDGEHFMIGGSSGVLELRNAEDGELVKDLQIDDATWKVVPTFNSSQILVVGNRTGVQVITLDLQELIDLAHMRVTRALTTEECQTYLHMEACP